jgi:hypothetical protein
MRKTKNSLNLWNTKQDLPELGTSKRHSNCQRSATTKGQLTVNHCQVTAFRQRGPQTFKGKKEASSTSRKPLRTRRRRVGNWPWQNFLADPVT